MLILHIILLFCFFHNYHFSNIYLNNNNHQQTRAIVGGGYTTRCNIPYIVKIERDQNYHHCGGSILNNKTIITAKHCVNTTGNLYIRIANQVFTNFTSIWHPSIDIAIIQLYSEIIYSIQVRPIRLYDNKRSNLNGAPILVAGYGRSYYFDYTQQNILKYNILYVQKIDSDIMYLAHKKDNGVCFGDSGGPAVLNNKLVGVASFIQKTCGSNLPDGFVYLPLFYDFIEKFIN